MNQNNIRIMVAQEFAILQSESATRPNGSPSRDGKNGKEHMQLICTSGTLILHDRGLSHIRCSRAKQNLLRYALERSPPIDGVGEGACFAATAAPTLRAEFYLTALHWPPTGSPTLP